MKENTFNFFVFVNFYVGFICCPRHVEMIFQFSVGIHQRRRCNCLNRSNDSSPYVLDIFGVKKNFLWLQKKNSSGIESGLRCGQLCLSPFLEHEGQEPRAGAVIIKFKKTTNCRNRIPTFTYGNLVQLLNQES